MKDDDDDDRPIGQKLHVMHVLDVQPGRAQDPEQGPPIGILTVGYREDVQPPMMFRIDDCRRLAVGFLAVLAHHEGGVAEEIVRKYLITDDGTPSTAALRPPKYGQPDETPIAVPKPSLPARGSHTPEIRLVAKFASRKIKPLNITVTGGYKSKSTVMVMGHSEDFGATVNMLVKIGQNNTLKLTGHRVDEVLPMSELPAFRERALRAPFLIRKRTWTKMTPGDIYEVIGRKKFQIVSV
jgi:hypothetical protein